MIKIIVFRRHSGLNPCNRNSKVFLSFGFLIFYHQKRCCVAGKNRDFARLQEGIAEITGSSVPAASVPDTAPGAQKESRERGRPKVDTAALQLRLPRSLITALVKEAAEASIAEGRNITPQQIIGRILEARYHG